MANRVRADPTDGLPQDRGLRHVITGLGVALVLPATAALHAKGSKFAKACWMIV